MRAFSARGKSSLFVALSPLLLLAGLAIRDRTGVSASTPVVPADGPIAVEVIDGQATFAIPRSWKERRFRVIVSSLAEPGPVWPVRLTREPASRAQVLSAITSVMPLARTASGIHPDDSEARRPSRAAVAPRLQTDASLTREFDLHVTEGSLSDSAQYTRVTARSVAEGKRVRIFLDDQCPLTPLRERQCREVAALTDEILPALEKELGEARDVDGDGTLAILMTPWLGKLQGGGTSIGGFVRSSDFRTDLPRPFSHRSDLLYLNADVPPSAELRTLLAHELTHVVAVGRRSAVGDEEDWVSEGLAHLFERRLGGWSNLDHRVARSLDSPGRYPLVVDDYFQAGLWRNHGCRGATWLFHDWCQSQFGPDLVRRIVESPHRGRATFEHATGAAFTDLFRAWTISLAEMAAGHPKERANRDDLNGGFERGESLLRGRFRDFGPRVIAWSAEDRAVDLLLAGTSATFIDVDEKDIDRSETRLKISAPPSSRLQVTVMPVASGNAALPVEQGTIAWATGPDPDSGESVASGERSSPIMVSFRLPASLRRDGGTLESVVVQRFLQTESTTFEYDFERGPLTNRTSGTPRVRPCESCGPLAWDDYEITGPPSSQRQISLGKAAVEEPAGPWLLRVIWRDAEGRRMNGSAPLSERLPALRAK